MKTIWKLTKEASRYKGYYIAAIISTLLLNVINLIAPKVLSSATGIISSGITAEGVERIKVLALILLGLYLLRILFRFMNSYLSHKAAWELVGDLRQRIYNKMQSLDLQFFEDKQTGDLMSRVVNDTREFELLYAHIIPDLISNVFIFIGVLVILLTINWRLALITCFPIPLILISGVIFTKKVRPHFGKNAKAMGEYNAKLQDNLSGIHEIQSFGRQSDESESVGKYNYGQVRAMLRALRSSAIFHPTVEFVASVGTVLVIFFGGVMALQGNLNIEDVIQFVLYLSLFYTPVSGLAQLLENLQQALSGAERVTVILDTESNIKERSDAKYIADVKGEITFDNVGFRYEEDVPVLENISFTARPGMMVAIVGPTGVGKTTITKLLSRFYDPTEGKVMIDGQDVSELKLDSLRKQISPVLQDTFLFNATIAENIGYAKPEASREEIESAAKAAFIHDDIMKMPLNYDTMVGERGLRLSGGQKQRVAIARAILRNSPIIVLDEATASVDVETEKNIQDAINAMTGSHTIVAIAHRLSTIKRADMILVVENGVITERGTHEELLHNKGYYYQMNLKNSMV